MTTPAKSTIATPKTRDQKPSTTSMPSKNLRSKVICKQSPQTYMTNFAKKHPDAARRFMECREGVKRTLKERESFKRCFAVLVTQDSAFEAPTSPPVELAEDEKKP